MFIRYEKIHRLGKEETEGILEGTCYIQEKIDGANTSIWVEDGEIKCGSRNNVLESGFNGFVDYVKNHEGINTLLKKHPEYRLYGEWCVRHTIQYNETSYKKFYLFDIMIKDSDFYEIPQVYVTAEKYGIDTPKLFDVIENPTVEQVMKYVGMSAIGEIGEGVVIKNFMFVNKFSQICYAKVVTEKFKEDNAICFGGNNKFSDTYWEMYVCNKYMTLQRIEKIIHKIEPTLDRKIDMQDIPRVMSTAFHDLITEEIWEIQKKVPSINFKSLQRVCYKKAKQIFVDILNNSISVADL
jgi:hypothetical protein